MKIREKWNQEKFLQRAAETHLGKYDYSKSKFKTINDKVEVICNCHGEPVSFFPIVSDHIKKGTGCPKCKSEFLRMRIKEIKGITLESFLKKAIEVHGDKYDYSRVIVTRAVDKVEVICKEHGSFFPTPQNHLNSGTGCPECGKTASTVRRVLPVNDFVSRCNEVHNFKYDYSKASYTKLHDFVVITCPDHGDFTQVAYDHLAGHGCDRCQPRITKPHQEILEMLHANNIQYLANEKLYGREFDIYCPEFRIAIEYNGLYWHSDHRQKDSQYHLSKTLLAEKNGIRLIHVWEDDWLFNNEKTKTWLLSQFDIFSSKSYARKLLSERIEFSEASIFVEKYHMQGRPSPCEYCYGLKDTSGELLAVMLLSSKTRGEGEVCLERFCSKGSVVGGFSKLLRAFTREFEDSFSSIVSFSDRSWSQGKVYLLNGFILESNGPPRYWWVKGQRRFDRRAFQRKYLEAKLEKFDTEKSEAENCYDNGYSKLYDCGLSKWVMNLP